MCKQHSESILRSEISVRGGVSDPESDQSTVDYLDPLYGLTFNLFLKIWTSFSFHPPYTFSQRLPVPFQVAAALSKLLPGVVEFFTDDRDRQFVAAYDFQFLFAT